MGIEQPATYYDKIWQRWERPSVLDPRSVLYAKAAAWAMRWEAVIDLGCGPGVVPGILNSWEWQGRYLGIDFSAVAIDKCNARNLPERFLFAQASIVGSQHNYDRPTVMVEVLEHIQDDLGVLGNVATGTPVFVTVPNFDDAGHVRHFAKFDDVFSRYGSMIEIEYATTIKKGPTTRWYLIEGVKK